MNRKQVVAVMALLLVLFTAAAGSATEEYAAATGAQCGICHIDPLGDGPLTEAGHGYRLAVRPGSPEGNSDRGVFGRALRLLFGYLHIMTAFMWFGTILYVHLVLKPAYASQGLPRGEVRVGLASMAIMAVTGAVLTWFKVDSWAQLVSSRFGILLLAKVGIFTVMVVSALYVVLLIGPKLKRKTAVAAPESGEFSPAELAGFDGGEGRPAYIAYRGKVYDVGASKLWKKGSHMQRHQAGIDLTAMLSQAPHGEDKILALPEVGRLAGRKVPDQDQARRRVFYFMAYMNLGLVFLVSLILALWRWF